jgi:hypothetical protein
MKNFRKSVLVTACLVLFASLGVFAQAELNGDPNQEPVPPQAAANAFDVWKTQYYQTLNANQDGTTAYDVAKTANWNLVNPTDEASQQAYDAAQNDKNRAPGEPPYDVMANGNVDAWLANNAAADIEMQAYLARYGYYEIGNFVPTGDPVIDGPLWEAELGNIQISNPSLYSMIINGMF